MSSQTLTFDTVCAELQARQAACDPAELQRVWAVASEAYDDRVHWTGIPLRQHVLQVMEQLAEFCPERDAMVACMLHHVLQLQEWTLPRLEKEYGKTVRSIVGGVHLLSHVTLRGRRTSIEELKMLLLSASDDLCVILISLCDCIVLLKRAKDMPVEEARSIAQDVLHLFAPVAARLGIYHLKQLLEELAFPIVYPSDAESLGEQLDRLHGEYPQVLEKMRSDVAAFLQRENLPAAVEAREKQGFSIFRKLREKGASSIHGIYDLFAVRVLVETPEDCYQVLGHLHRFARPVVNRFKDYIAFPKPNGYRSLHTTLTDLPGLPPTVFLEVQIRTHAMHQEAQYGVASHWLYKEGGAATARALQAAKILGSLALQETLEDQSSGLAQLADHIFVLTPHGDVIELPEGAVPLDFAFTVHSTLGLHFQAARVNGSIVPLDYELQNGDVVEIQKRSTPQPSPHWLQLLKMSSSRAKLKKYLLLRDRPDHVTEGRALLNEELKRHGLPQLDSDLSVLRFVEGAALNAQEREDLVAKVGLGAEKASSALNRCDVLHGKLRHTEPQRRRMVTSPLGGRTLSIEGDIPLPLQFAKCCKPEDGYTGELMGIVTRKAVVMIHRKNCRMTRQSTPSRHITVHWD